MLHATRIFLGIKFKVPSPLHHAVQQHESLLVSPFGAELHGFNRGPQSIIPPSPEVALALLTEAVPFHQDALIIFPENRQGASESTILSQMREHFLRVHHGCMTLLPHDVGAKRFSTPLETLAEGSLDIVCFSGNCFATVLEQCAVLISEAHRALRRHGVVAIHGSRRLRVVAPERAVVDYNDFSAFIENEYFKLPISTGTSQRYKNRSASVECGHSDIYLPFPHVKRRWFTSAYRVPVSHLTGYIRGWETYQAVVKPSRYDGDPPGVRRHRVGRVDPLQAFEGLLLESGEEVTVEVDTFVVTCDSRPHNGTSAIGDGVGDGGAFLTQK